MEKQNQQNLFKEVMGNYPTGVTIVTTCDENGNPVGLTVNSFASVSIDPLLILWSIDHRVSSLNTFKMADSFVVHVLAGDQQKLCQLFASRNTDRFGNCKWGLSSQNMPILEDTFAVLECKKYKQVEAGDHTILIGEVTNITVHEKEPMLYHRRNFGPIPAEFHAVPN